MKPPIAAMRPSSLQSLVRDEKPTAGVQEKSQNSSPLKPSVGTTPLSSLLQDDRRKAKLDKINQEKSPIQDLEWWNEKPKRPVGYVKHFQPMNTSYVKKFEPPRDYGDVVTATAETIPFPEDMEENESYEEEEQEEDVEQ